MQENTTTTTTTTGQVYAVRYAELHTRLGFFTAEQLTQLFGVGIDQLVTDPAGVSGITTVALDLTEDGKTVRTAVKAMVPSITEVGAALTAGWPAVAVDADVLRGFLAETYELASDWQANATTVADMLDVVLADDEMLAESGISFAEGWKITAATAKSRKVHLTLEQTDRLPIDTDAITTDTLVGLTEDTGVEAAVAALTHLAYVANQRAAAAAFADADTEALTADTTEHDKEDAAA